MPRYASRIISLTIWDRDLMEKFLELLPKRLRNVDIVHVEVKLNNVRIKVYGDVDSVKEASIEAQKLYKELLGALRPDREGFFCYNLSHILSEARLETAIPLDLIPLVLSLRGFESKIEGKHLKSKAKYEDVLHTIELFSKKYKEALSHPLKPSARRLVAVYATVREAPVKEVVARLQKLGLLKTMSDGTLMLTKNFNDALTTLLST